MVKSSEISVVVQGPVYKKATKKCLNSIRKVLPEAEIMFFKCWLMNNTC